MDPITRSLWCLAFFIQRDGFRVHPHCSKDHSTLSSTDGNLGFFHLLANRVVVNACVQVSVFKSLGFIPRSGILGSVYILFHLRSFTQHSDSKIVLCGSVLLCGSEVGPFSQLSRVPSCGRFIHPFTGLSAFRLSLVWGF